MTRIPTEVVATQPSGEMDYDALAAALAKHPGRPAIINATVGTTVTEAWDTWIDQFVEALARDTENCSLEYAQ